MSNNYDDYGYEDKDYNDGSAAKKRILIGFLIVAAIIIVVLLILKGCSKNDKPKTPIEKIMVKTYYFMVIQDLVKHLCLVTLLKNFLIKVI